MKRKISRSMLVYIVCAVVILAGSILVSSPNAVTSFPVNSNGETYGDLFQLREAGADPV